MRLMIRLISDSSFGRGDGLMGVVDSEIEHDKTTGLPIIKGRTLKGLLVEACADILYSLQLSVPAFANELETSASRLFGQPGSSIGDAGSLHIATATLPPDLILQVQQGQFAGYEVLDAMTTIRYQTAVDRTTDTPLQNSLRATRAVIRETIFLAPITITGSLDDKDFDLLAACIATVRRAGQNRSRGTGLIEITLIEADFDYFGRFIRRVEAAS